MDETKLREMYKRDRVARAFFDHMVRREHSQTETVNHFLELLNEKGEQRFDQDDIRDLFKKLQQLGCGRYIVGRHGRLSRFEWYDQSLNAMLSMYFTDLGVFLLLAFQKLIDVFGSKTQTRVALKIEDMQKNTFFPFP